VYLGVLKILTTPDVAELRIQSGTHTRMPINCGTQVTGASGACPRTDARPPCWAPSAAPAPRCPPGICARSRTSSRAPVTTESSAQPQGPVSW